MHRESPYGHDRSQAIETGLVSHHKLQLHVLPAIQTGAINVLAHIVAGISDLPALDGPFIHPKAAQRPKLLFVTASSRFRGRQLSPW